MDVTVLQSIDWEVLVVDEAHRLKNNQSKVCGMERGGRRGKGGGEREEGEGRREKGDVCVGGGVGRSGLYC